jgi:hypothetical protein
MRTFSRTGKDSETGVIRKPSVYGERIRTMFVDQRSLWEDPPRRVVAKIAKALGISVDDLLS